MKSESWYFKSCDLKVVYRQKVADRLSKTCFRDNGGCWAGNFFAFPSFTEVLSDPVIKREFIEQLMEAFEEGEIGTQSFIVDAGRLVGWSSTASYKQFPEEMLESFVLNGRATALRVKPEVADQFKAPKTEILTVVCELKLEERNRVAVIHSLYPGEDIGELVGDVTGREGVVFFTWEHPGEV